MYCLVIHKVLEVEAEESLHDRLNRRCVSASVGAMASANSGSWSSTASMQA